MMMESTVSQWGGARVGWLNATWPFAVLSVTKDDLCLSVLFHEYNISKQALGGLSRYRGVFSKGLRIEHTDPSLPKLVVFWSLNFEKLKAGLESLGYTIRD